MSLICMQGIEVLVPSSGMQTGLIGQVRAMVVCKPEGHTLRGAHALRGARSEGHTLRGRTL